MATLVLSTIGTALGGPVGGAIGALVGQSIDQELLAPVKRGPRVGDLTVQTSSYGTQMPRIYGTMRVAGTVIWSTDLIEHSSTDGAKGQPDVTYSYTVSFAVALSSRRASSIGRIWADGNLLRGTAGDLKVGGKLRFYDGSEDQLIDPLIGSVEGLANTPAYRGLALAVFEDLELADFGSRIPILSFEIEADDDPQTIGAIVTDASAGAISIGSAQTLTGYAAYGKSIRDAVQALVDAFGIELFDDGESLRGAAAADVEPVSAGEFGNSVDQQSVSSLEREQASVRSLPATLRVTYYDAARDYQTGEVRAVAGEQDGAEVQQDLAAALDAGSAKSLAQQMIARSWAQRDKLTLRLPPKRIALEPGSRLSLPLTPTDWVVDQVSIDGFVVVTELHPSIASAASIAGDGGRVAPTSDVVAGPLSLALLDVPNPLSLPSAGPLVLLAATSASAGWKRQAVDVSFGGQSVAGQTAQSKSLLGQVITLLPDRTAELIDDISTVDVELVDETQWLTSCDNDALAAGHNLAMLGSEVMQFGNAAPLGDGRFRLGRLLRGRGGTEWACATHVPGDPFCLLQPGTFQPVTLPSWSIGATLQATSASDATVSTVFYGECVRPPSPVNLTADLQPDGTLAVSWVRRSRQGFAWVDGIDAPLGETIEQYRISLSGITAAVELTTDQASATVTSAILAGFGAGPLSIEVRQVGDFAVSHPARTSITLP